MVVTVAEANSRLPELIRIAEQGQPVTITRHGKIVAQLGPAPPASRPEVIFGGLRDRIKLKPGWDDPMTEEELLGSRFAG